MKKKPCSVISLLIVIIAIPLWGCGKDDGYKPARTAQVETVRAEGATAESIMPFAPGNQWFYTVTYQNSALETELKVQDVRQESGGTTATIEISTIGGSPHTQEWMVDSSGLYQMTAGSDGEAFVPPQLLVKLPIVVGDEYEQTCTGRWPIGGSGEFHVKSRVVGTQEVDSGIGRLSAIAIESFTTWENNGVRFEAVGMTWWVPGIGFVRQRQAIVNATDSIILTHRLQSYSFKN